MNAIIKQMIKRFHLISQNRNLDLDNMDEVGYKSGH